MVSMMFPLLKNTCDSLVRNFGSISDVRKQQLDVISQTIQQQLVANHSCQILFVCTHNSRRSQFGQVWASVAAAYYGVNNVEVDSAGTEVTAFHSNAIQALRLDGFQLLALKPEQNTRYLIDFGGHDHLQCFSKHISELSPDFKEVIAIMTCSEADEQCPYIPGVAQRFSLPYSDPKLADGTPTVLQMYHHRSREIARDCLYLFSKINTH
jgi:arsenate reductase